MVSSEKAPPVGEPGGALRNAALLSAAWAYAASLDAA